MKQSKNEAYRAALRRHVWPISVPIGAALALGAVMFAAPAWASAGGGLMDEREICLKLNIPCPGLELRPSVMVAKWEPLTPTVPCPHGVARPPEADFLLAPT